MVTDDGCVGGEGGDNGDDVSSYDLLQQQEVYTCPSSSSSSSP
jgi:hypothetical protein